MLRTIGAASGAVGILAAALFLLLERPEWVPGIDVPSDQVLVFVVGSTEGVGIVRDAVDPARIVADTSDAIALVEGRIVAATTEAVSAPYTEAGWTDRPLEFFRLEKNDGLARRRVHDADGGEVDPERLDRLRELVKKPTLSYGEQVFILQAMNDGIAF